MVCRVGMSSGMPYESQLFFFRNIMGSIISEKNSNKYASSVLYMRSPMGTDAEGQLESPQTKDRSDEVGDTNRLFTNYHKVRAKIRYCYSL